MTGVSWPPLCPGERSPHPWSAADDERGGESALTAVSSASALAPGPGRGQADGPLSRRLRGPLSWNVQSLKTARGSPSRREGRWGLVGKASDFQEKGIVYIF